MPFGTLQPARIAELSSWMVHHGLIGAPLTFARYGTDAFLPGAALAREGRAPIAG